MANKYAKIERLLEVGRRVILHFRPTPSTDGIRCKTAIRGWRKPEYITVDLAPLGKACSLLHQDGLCVVRFTLDGTAYGFDTNILDWDRKASRRVLFLSWPTAVEQVSFRKYERISLNSSCKVTTEDTEFEGELCDLSFGGCRILCRNTVPEGETVTLSLALPNGRTISDIRAVVRSVVTEGRQVAVGCQFIEGQECVECDIAAFVSNALAQDRADGKPTERLVFIDENPQTSVALREAVGDEARQVVAVTGVIDGLARLRMAPVTALFISRDQDAIDCFKMCDLVRKTPGLEDLSIFIYGGDDPGLQEQAGAAGASGYFPNLKAAEGTVRALVKTGAAASEE